MTDGGDLGPTFLPFDDRGQIVRSENRLPHWEQGGCAYFVTFRLADSLPAVLLAEWEADRAIWLEQNPGPLLPDLLRVYQVRFSNRMESALDDGCGRCSLRDPAVSRLVGDSLLFFEGTRCRQLAFVVMPNHVHALFVALEPWSLSSILHRWKSYTAKRINELIGSSGAVWQKDSFDRIVRDVAHFERCVRYIRRNPAKAGLRNGEYLLWESEAARKLV